jgi:hypothetical protein
VAYLFNPAIREEVHGGSSTQSSAPTQPSSPQSGGGMKF